MRFGGHETFPVREDWLSKGLFLLDSEPDAFEDRLVSDRLGVGRNMGKAIWHWLKVTSLVQKNGRGQLPELTSSARTILNQDPYMLSVGTWWALHIHLVAQEREAIAWPWFFNRFDRDRFHRGQCIEQLRQYVSSQAQKLPAQETLTRDVACLLATYAQSVPPSATDPEEGQECPFRELGLITYFRESDTYQINRGKKDIPAALVGYDLAVSCDDGGHTTWFEISINEALTRPAGPGRAFALTAEALADIIETASHELGEDIIQTRLMGSERYIRVARQPPVKWLETYYRG